MIREREEGPESQATERAHAGLWARGRGHTPAAVLTWRCQPHPDLHVCGTQPSPSCLLRGSHSPHRPGLPSTGSNPLNLFWTILHNHTLLRAALSFSSRVLIPACLPRGPRGFACLVITYKAEQRAGPLSHSINTGRLTFPL